VTRWSCEVAEVKRIARQVVEALPDDASFSDLEEFLFERAMVEAGRDDIREGRVRTAAELAPWANRGTWDVAVVWSEQSAVAFVEAFQGSHSDSPENARAFEGAVAQAASHARWVTPVSGRCGSPPHGFGIDCSMRSPTACPACFGLPATPPVTET